MNVDFDDDRITAATMLVGHTGARDLEIGYLHDDVPSEQAAWWATSTYKGAKMTVENKRGPLEAIEALAVELLTGAKCTWCDGLIALSPDGAIAFAGGRMMDGTRMPADPDEIAALGQCLWRRNGPRWEPGCVHGQSTAPGAPQGRSAMRRLYRRYEATRPRART